MPSALAPERHPEHPHAHPHAHGHVHAHGAGLPHPAQPARWSILRMTLLSRLGAAAAVSAALWLVVVLAMR